MMPNLGWGVEAASGTSGGLRAGSPAGWLRNTASRIDGAFPTEFTAKGPFAAAA